ncbi:MAG: DUF2490 domain-containing protein, partial [Bdellovibrionales bacterium]|nr:DUF2490 domain-containing protein [Bdellovibrionales bacterium]
TFSKKEITEGYYGWIEGQLRYGFDQGGVNQFLYRTGLLVDVAENHQLGFLYAFIQAGIQKEHRFALQHVQKYGQALGLSMSHRVRLEYRTLEISDVEAGRFRYLSRAEGETKPSPTLVVWDEVFINTTRDSWTGNMGFDRNRLFIGVKTKIYNIRGEFGYLNQYVPRDSGDISEHIATFYFFV